MERSAGRPSAARLEAPFERVPHAFEAVHHPLLAHAAWRDACDALRDPVQVRTTPAGRAAMLTQQALFTFDADGAVRVTVVRPREDGRFLIGRLSPDEVCVSPMLPRGYWLQMRRQRLAARTMRALCDAAHEADGEAAAFDADALRPLVDAWTRWVFERIRRDLASRFELSAVRARMTAGLGLDPEVLGFARRLRRRHRSPALRSVTTLGDYEAARRHLGTLRRLHARAPALLAPWSAVFANAAPDALPATDPVRALRAWVRGLGCSQRTWRLLATHGTRTLDAVDDFYLCAHRVRDWPRALADWLVLLDALALRRMPPAWLMRALLGLLGGPRAPRADYGQALARHERLPLLRHAFACLQRRPDWGLAERDEVLRELERRFAGAETDRRDAAPRRTA